LLWWVSVCKCLLVLLNSCCHDWCRQPCNTNRRDSRRGHGRSIGAPAARPRRREPGNAREPLPWRWRQCVARRHAVGGADRWWHLNRVTSQKHNRNCRGFFCGHKQHKRPGRRRSLVVLPNHLSRAFISPLLEAFKGLRVLSLGMDHNRFR
jgi:hypothetical protein